MIEYELIESHLLHIYEELILPDIFEQMEESEDLIEDAIFAVGAYEKETNRPVGAVVFDQANDALELVSIMVAYDFRRQKIGSNLIGTACSVVLSDDESKESVTFVCTYRLPEKEHVIFDAFMQSIGVEDFLNLPEGIVFKLGELKKSEKMHEALYGIGNLPENIVQIDDYSFEITDAEGNVYSSIASLRNLGYFKLILSAEGEDSALLSKVFEATAGEMVTLEKLDDTYIDVTFNDAFTEEFIGSLGLSEYEKVLSSHAVTIFDRA